MLVDNLDDVLQVVRQRGHIDTKSDEVTQVEIDVFGQLALVDRRHADQAILSSAIKRLQSFIGGLTILRRVLR